MLGKKLAIDLGSGTVRAQVRGEGGPLAEPAVVARGDDAGRTSAFGLEALMRAQRPGVRLVRPLIDGHVADGAALDALLVMLINRVAGRQRIFKPDIMVVVPSGLPGQDRRLVMDVCARAGARTTYLIDSPIAAAIGCGLPVASPRPQLIVNLGSETSDMAVVSMEGIVAGRCLPIGGRRLTAAIAEAEERQSGTRLSDASAEEAKLEVGSAVPLLEERVITLAGTRPDGAPVEAALSSVDVTAALRTTLRAVAEGLAEVAAEAPQVLAEEVRRSGGTITGGGARLRGVDRYLTGATGIPLRIAPEPESCAIRGCSAAVENLDVLRRNFLYIR